MSAKFVIAVLVAASVAAVVATSALAGPRPVTRAQYLTMLKSANAQVSRVEGAAEQGLTPKATRAHVQALIRAWAATESRLGRSFRAVRPPAAVVAANTLLGTGEIVYGGELAAAAGHLPAAKAKIGPFLQSALGHAKGAAMIDRALAKLKRAGYRAG